MSTSFAAITAPVTGKPDVNPATNPQASGPVKPQPGAPKPTLVKPNGAPVPVLQQLGYHGGIADFNAALQGVVDAHTKTFGYQPKPDIALKAVVTTPPAQVPHLFTPATTNPTATAALAANPVTSDRQFITEMRQQAAGPGWDNWLQANGDRVQLLEGQKQWQAQIHGIVLQRNTRDAFLTRAQANGATPDEARQQLAHAENVQAAGIGDIGLIGRPAGQIIGALVHAPGGALAYADQFLRAVGELDRATPVGADQQAPAAAQFVETNKAVGKGFKQDFQHPGRNSGYLFLDILGLASLGAGTAARVTAAGRAIRAGEGVEGAAKALSTKPPLQRATVDLGGYTEEMPLSANPLVAAVQKRVLGARQTAANERAVSGPTPIRSMLMPDWAEEHLSFERKVGREADARQRVEHTANMTLANHLVDAAGNANLHGRILGRIPRTEHAGLSRGEQRAIQVLSWDDPNPIEADRAFHQYFIDADFRAAQHRAALADLTLAEKALANPRPQFQKILDLTRATIEDQQRVRVEQLGLAPETAEGRIANAGRTLRNEPLGPFPKTEPVNDVYFNQHGDVFPTHFATEVHNDVRNIHDEYGNPVGSIVYDARPHQKSIYIESVYIDPGFRGVENLRRLVQPLLADGRPISADFDNPRLQALFDRVAQQRGVGDKAKATGRTPIERGTAPAEPRPIVNKLGEMVPAQRVSEDSFYLPTQPRGKVKRGPSQIRGKFGLSAGPYGIPIPRPLAELTHTFEGNAMRAGDIRIDSTNLAYEAAAKTYRAAVVKNEWAKLWEASSPVQRSEWDIPIRDVNEIQDELRAFVAKLDEGYVTAQDAAGLPADLASILYPKKETLADEEIKNTRWVDGRLVGNIEGAPSRSAKTAARFASAVNSPFRFAALYARPAYALNKLGNHAMLIFDQGFLNSIENLGRAMSVKDLYGEADAAQIRAHVGAGKSRSYVTTASGRVSQAVAEFWNRFADRDERVASFLYYADRKGYRTPEEMHRLLHDETARADLTEVVRRSNKALVEFDNMTPFEKNVLRHFVFVYPWVRGSAVWSLRAVMEHPAKTALLAELGKQEILNDPFFEHAPAWFKRIGYIPGGWNHDGTPKVINPTSINTFSTLSDFASIVQANTVGDKYASASDLFGPAASFFVHTSIGRDEYGNKYAGNQAVGAMREVLLGLPQLTKLRARTNKPLTAFDIRQRSSLESSLRSALHETVFSPGWLDGYGNLIAGGLTQKGLNPRALEERYWADQSPKVRAQRELRLLNEALSAQGDFLKRDVPASVRQTVRYQARLTQMYGDFAKANGRAPTDAERRQIQQKFLTANGRTVADEKKALKELHRWDADVRSLYSFKADTFNEKAAGLFKQGLSPQARYKVPQEALYDYGRKFVAWTNEVRDARKNGATAADLRLMTDEHSKPVGGLPSFAAIAWANQTPAEQKHALAANLGAGWGTLTAVEKQLLGKPVDPAVTEAWRAYQTLTGPKELAKQLPAGQRSLDKTQRLAVVKQIDRYYDLRGKFLQDYLFSKQPLYQRLPYMTAVKDSPHRDDWQQLFRRANDLETAVANKQTTMTVARDAWRDYTTQLTAYYRTENPGFWKELQPILRADPSFLTKLIS